MLVVGSSCDSVATKASQIEGTSKVIWADHEVYAHQLAENMAPLVVEIGKSYDYIVSSGNEVWQKPVTACCCTA